MSLKRLRCQESVRDFNSKFKIGDKVEYDGVVYKLWSQAAIGPRDEPCVFLEGRTAPIEPVPIDKLKIEGWDLTYGKRAKKTK